MQCNISLDSDFNLKVGAHKIYIKYVACDDANLGNSGKDDGNYARWVPKEYTMYVNKDEPESMRLSSLFHELMHVFEDIYEIKISHKDINIVGDAMAQIFFDNFKVGE